MKKSTWALATISLVLIVLVYRDYSTGVQLNGLEAQVATLSEQLRGHALESEADRAQLRERASTLAASLSDAVSRLDADLQTLRTPPTSSQIADEILNKDIDGLVSQLATRISSDSESVEVLRGNPGEDADPEEVAEKLLANGTDFLPLLADRLWESHRSELVRHEGLIATVADEVYKKYGPELKAREAQGPSAKAIAEELAKEPGFAELVALFQKQ